jgi:hypothetical protein
VLIVLVTIVTPYTRRLSILRRLAYSRARAVSAPDHLQILQTLELRKCLTFQQSPKQAGVIRTFLQVHQVLNLMDIYINRLILSSWHQFLYIVKCQEYLQTEAVVWIHEELQLGIHLVYILHLENKWKGGRNYLRK